MAMMTLRAFKRASLMLVGLLCISFLAACLIPQTQSEAQQCSYQWVNGRLVQVCNPAATYSAYPQPVYYEVSNYQAGPAAPAQSAAPAAPEVSQGDIVDTLDDEHVTPPVTPPELRQPQSYGSNGSAYRQSYGSNGGYTYTGSGNTYGSNGGGSYQTSYAPAYAAVYTSPAASYGSNGGSTMQELPLITNTAGTQVVAVSGGPIRLGISRTVGLIAGIRERVASFRYNRAARRANRISARFGG